MSYDVIELPNFITTAEEMLDIIAFGVEDKHELFGGGDDGIPGIAENSIAETEMATDDRFIQDVSAEFDGIAKEGQAQGSFSTSDTLAMSGPIQDTGANSSVVCVEALNDGEFQQNQDTEASSSVVCVTALKDGDSQQNENTCADSSLAFAVPSNAEDSQAFASQYETQDCEMEAIDTQKQPISNSQLEMKDRKRSLTEGVTSSQKRSNLVTPNVEYKDSFSNNPVSKINTLRCFLKEPNRNIRSTRQRHQETNPLEVPADGLCFYHCLVAAENVRDWNTLNPKQKTEKAKLMRTYFIAFLREIGNIVQSERLTLEGPGGYPGLDDFPNASQFMGCPIRLRMESELPKDLEIRYPPDHDDKTTQILMLSCTVTDGSGHQSSHYNLIQSWLCTEIFAPDGPEYEARKTLTELNYRIVATDVKESAANFTAFRIRTGEHGRWKECVTIAELQLIKTK